jgi:hypothetical protein
VEATVQALLAIVNEGTPVKFRPWDVSKEIQYVKLGKACSLDDIPIEYLRNLPNITIVHLPHLFNHCFQLSHLPDPSKEAKIITAKTRQGPKISPRLTSDQILVEYGQTIWEAYKNNPKTYWAKKLTKRESVLLSSRSEHDTSINEAGGSHHPKLQHIIVILYFSFTLCTDIIIQSSQLV